MKAVQCAHSYRTQSDGHLQNTKRAGHRDVAQALVLMVLANAVYHLAAAGLFGVSASGRPEWWLIVGV
ncbi:hypothetical protein KBZ21_40595, partial [Streptomyces sp. A73]|nr:hypothetical protein [Streptomyces sp. A73]